MTLIRTSSRHVMPQQGLETSLSPPGSGKSDLLLDARYDEEPNDGFSGISQHDACSAPLTSIDQRTDDDDVFAQKLAGFQDDMMPNSNLEGLYVPPQNYSYDNADIPNGCNDDQDDLETGFGPSALEEITDVRINRLTNRFVGANRLESTYGRIRLRENAPLLRWASGLLLLCFSLDCISLLLRRSTLHAALIIVLCSMTCFQLGLFLFRNRLYSHLLIHYYQYVTTALGASAFSYVVFSDTVVACVFYGSTEPSCVTPGERTWRIEDSTRVAYGMSLLFGIMPFGFRVNFLNCLIMYTCALIVHLLLRTLSFLDAGFEYSRGSVFDAVLLDSLFLITIMATLLYGAYMYERNDRLVFIRMRRSQLESDQLQNELQMVREELGWAEDEANTNELKLEIERAKSDLDRMYPGAQIELQSWVLPFDALIIDKRVGEGSCGEVFRGRVRSQNACGGDLSSETFSARLLRRTPSCSLLSVQSFATSHPSQALVSPQNKNFAAYSGEPWGGDACASSTIGPSRGLPAHRRDYSVMPSSQVVAIKRIPKHKITRKTVLSLLQETLAMSKCKHPNVLRLVGLVYDPFVCVVFEYMALGSLKDLLDASHPSALRPSLPQRTTSKLAPSDMSGKFPAMQSMRDRDNDIFRDAERKLQRESAIQALQEYTLPGKCVWTHTKTRMCVNVAAGVSYMHSKDIIHRDLKSSNLMVDATHAVKVADLGTARQLSHPYGLQQEPGNQNAKIGRSARPMSRVGSPLWIAPEVISSEGEYDHKCDVWSFGVILCELMTHRDPYTDAKGRSKFNLLNVVEGTLSPLDFVDDVLEYTPPAIVRLARDCCNFDPQRRCTMKEALFRLLQIVVEQETHKFEADAIAAAGPYLRYSQPSRINVTAPRLASTSMDVTHGENFAQEPLFASQDGFFGTQVPDHRRTSRDYSAHTLSSTDDVLVDTLNQRDLDDLAASSEEEVETEVTEDEDEDEDEGEHKEISREEDGYADQKCLNNPSDRVCKENAKASDGSVYLKERSKDKIEDGDDDDGDDEEEDVVVLVPRDSIGSSKDEDSESDLDDGFVSHLNFGANLDNHSMDHNTSSKDVDQISVAGPLRGSEGLLQDMNSNSAQTLSDARLRPESMSTFGDSSAAGASMRVDIAEGSIGSIEGGAIRRVDSTMRPTLRQTSQSRKHASNSRLTRTQQGETQESRRGEARNRPQSMTATPSGLPGSEFASFGETSRAQTLFLFTQGKPLRPCMSTHNLGETLAQEKVQSLLSTYPSMGSMVSSNYTGSRGPNMLESTLSERLRASSRRSGARSERTRDRRKQSQSCRVKRHSTTDAVRGNNPSGSHARLKQSTSMRNSFQCIVEF